MMSAPRTFRIAAIPGDGVGREVVAAGREVLDALAGTSSAGTSSAGTSSAGTSSAGARATNGAGGISGAGGRNR